jgi:Ca2+-transporting ATPase
MTTGERDKVDGVIPPPSDPAAARPGTSTDGSWHAIAAAEVVAAVGSDEAQGLSQAEVATRVARDGPNALPEARSRSLLSVVAGQFKSPLVWLLFVAAAVAAALGEYSDAAVIAVVVALNAVIGAFQEGRAEQSLRALRKLAELQARVVRGGSEALVPARELVVGDVVVLEAGDAVPADARLLTVASFKTAEAALTGESLPVEKSSAPLPADTGLADRVNVVFAGTHVVAGRARAVVVAIGTATEVGRIAALAESGVVRETPLERRVSRFGRVVVAGAVLVFVLVNVVGAVRGLPWMEILMVSISQVVGMIPEGLPVAMTIALAVGVQRMAGRNAVVRKLSAVETLGSTTVICSDKTGTLTRNEMTVTTLVLPDGREVVVGGSGYDPVGTLLVDGAPAEADPAVRALLEAVTLCGDAELSGPHDEGARWRPVGDPTEVALVTVARKAGLVPEDVRRAEPRVGELPFDSAVQAMATAHAGRVLVKGAPEVVLGLCGLDEAARAAVAARAESLAAKALRVLAVAEVPGGVLEGGLEPLRGRAVHLGLVGQFDPPRLEVADAVARCRAAGIRPVVVTGDHAATGLAIARTLGIAVEGDLAVDGRALAAMSEEELTQKISSIAVFARVQPAQKLRIVEAWQRSGAVVAMTGDGVNDAPALVKADVGVAMGVTGTEVAKESADIVLVDDNFATLVAAVEEGRVIYRNIQKAMLLLFSTSAAEVVILLVALLLGFPPPFAAVQILWNNLVTEGLVTVNLVLEGPEGDEMERPPISTREPLLSRTILLRMALMVPVIALVVLGWFAWRTAAGVPEQQVQTEAFTLLAVCEWYNVLNCRSERHSALTWSLFRNRWLVGGLVLGNLLQLAVVYWSPLASVFHTVPFEPWVVLALGAVGSVVLWVEEARKLVVRLRAAR